MEPQNVEPKSVEQQIAEENLVERYATGRLGPEEAARFEEYFLARPEVAAEVRAAQRLAAGLATVARREAARTLARAGLWQRLGGQRLGGQRIAPLLALWLFALLALPLWHQARRAEELEARLTAAIKPRVNTPIFELSRYRATDAAPQRLSLTPDLEWIVLVLPLPEGEDGVYRVEWRNAAGEPRLEAADLRPDSLGRLVMSLPASTLPRGEHELRVLRAEGETAGEPAGETVARFALRVTAEPPDPERQ